MNLCNQVSVGDLLWSFHKIITTKYFDPFLQISVEFVDVKEHQIDPYFIPVSVLAV